MQHTFRVTKLVAFLVALCVSHAAKSSSGITWVDWSPAAFETAKKEKKLIILDLEAVWCHWCHVMHKETYSDPAVAKLISEHFVAIKVDQDARPDISRRYEDYGWPATIIFDSEGRELAKRSGFIEKQPLLATLNKLLKNPVPEPGDQEITLVVPQSAFLTKEQKQSLMAMHADQYDEKQSGWGKKHKFLFGNSEELAMRNAWMSDAKESKRATDTLTKAKKLIDPVWGGIYQYSVKTWNELHYEKIPTSQTRALFLYSLGYNLFKDEAYKTAANDIRKFLNAFLRDPSGAYYVSQDADVVAGQHSEGFFKLGDAARRKIGIPRIDKHLYARENGSFAKGLLWLYRATLDETVLNDAKAAVSWVEKNRSLGIGGFRHDEKDAGGPYLGDTLQMASAFLALYEVTAQKDYLTKAQKGADFIEQNFAHKVSGKIVGYQASAKSLSAALDSKPDRDENIDLTRFANLLYQYNGEARNKTMAENAMRYLVNPDVLEFYPAAGTLLADTELSQNPVHITIVGAKGDTASADLFRSALSYPTSYRRIEWWDKSEGALPRNDVTYPSTPKPAAFACIDGRCSLPIFDAKALHTKIDALYGKKKAKA